MRAMWKAALSVGEAMLPVKLYAAVQDRDVHFHLLHDRDAARVKQKMVHPETGEPVAREEIRRAYEPAAGLFVLVEPSELEVATPAPSRTISVTRYVAGDALEHPWYDRPYYLGPDGDDARYVALAAVLERGKRIGIAHWVMRKKRYHGVLSARDGQLRLITLRKRDEVVELGKLKAPTGRKLDSRELALAEQLVAALAGDFEPEAYRDEHRERLLELIETKRKGGTIEKVKPVRRAAPASLASALSASLKREKHARSEHNAHKEKKSA